MPEGVTLSRQSLASWRIGLQPAPQMVKMGIKRLDPPDCPTFAVIVERFAGDGDRFGTVRRAGSHCEHKDFGACAEERAEVAVANSLDIGLVALVTADRHASPKIGGGADLSEVMVAAELTVRMARDPAEKEVALHVPGAFGLIEKGLRQAPGAASDRQADEASDLSQHRFQTLRGDVAGFPVVSGSPSILLAFNSL